MFGEGVVKLSPAFLRDAEVIARGVEVDEEGVFICGVEEVSFEVAYGWVCVDGVAGGPSCGEFGDGEEFEWGDGDDEGTGESRLGKEVVPSFIEVFAEVFWEEFAEEFSEFFSSLRVTVLSEVVRVELGDGDIEFEFQFGGEFEDVGGVGEDLDWEGEGGVVEEGLEVGPFMVFPDANEGRDVFGAELVSAVPMDLFLEGIKDLFQVHGSLLCHSLPQ